MIEESRRLVPTVSSVSADSLAEMQYTQQVLEETLRLYPPVWLFTRRSCAEDELDAFDVPELGERASPTRSPWNYWTRIWQPPEM